MHVVAGADGQESLGLTFDQFVEQVINHRPSTKANVLDCAQLRSVMNQELKQLEIMIDSLARDINVAQSNNDALRHSHPSASGPPVALHMESTEDLFEELFRRSRGDPVPPPSTTSKYTFSKVNCDRVDALPGHLVGENNSNGGRVPRTASKPSASDSSTSRDEPRVLGSLAGPLNPKSAKHPPAVELQ